METLGLTHEFLSPPLAGMVSHTGSDVDDLQLRFHGGKDTTCIWKIWDEHQREGKRRKNPQLSSLNWWLCSGLCSRRIIMWVTAPLLRSGGAVPRTAVTPPGEGGQWCSSPPVWGHTVLPPGGGGAAVWEGAAEQPLLPSSAAWAHPPAAGRVSPPEVAHRGEEKSVWKPEGWWAKSACLLAVV